MLSRMLVAVVTFVCAYVVSISDQPDDVADLRVYFTEVFEADDNDLAFITLTFIPDESPDYYSLYVEAADAFPIEPVGGTPLAFDDADSELVTLEDGIRVSLYGVEYGQFYAGANGYIAFAEPDADHTESIENHFRLPCISGLFTSLDPSSGGMVSWKQLADRAVVTFDSVTEYGYTNRNSFQVELFLGGVIRITYLENDAPGGTVGLSDGTGFPSDFIESDLSAYPYGVPDVDGDGLPDFWEELHGLDPTDATGDNGPDGDPDGDGIINVQEYAAGGGAEPELRASDVVLRISKAGPISGSPFDTGNSIDSDTYGSRDVYAADIDGDGDLDVLGAASRGSPYTEGLVIWWENNASAGTWTEHSVDSSFNGATCVYAADVDADGDLDVLGAAYQDHDITWWENTNGAGTSWTEHVIDGNFGAAEGVYAADLDDDGDMDILGAARAADLVSWWENDGTPRDGGWTEHTIDNACDGARNVYAADFDGDGDFDVIGANYNTGNLSWWENDGTPSDGGWVEHEMGWYYDASDVHADDLDGDGDIDIVASSDHFNLGVRWWENDGSGGTWTVHTIEQTYDDSLSVHAADVDGDGDVDVIATAYITDDIRWWENVDGRATTWSVHILDAAYNGARSEYVADLDGDGDMDILGAAMNAPGYGLLTWWQNETIHRSAVFPTEHTVDGAFNDASSACAVDVDGDGDSDVIGGGDNDVAWWENTDGVGGSWTERTVDTDFTALTTVWVDGGDVDGDGDQDILGACDWNHDITWWENANGAGTSWIERTVDGSFNGAIAVFGADMDGDGDLDLVGAANIAAEVAWWENTDGTGTSWSKRSVDAAFNGARMVHAADVDGDGDLDILGAAASDDDISWWENTSGDGTTWSEHAIDVDFNGAYSVYAADIDRDGDVDVLGAANDGNLFSWWENTNSAGTSWTERTVGTFAGARHARAADMDGDGDLDVVAAVYAAGYIVWYENVNGNGTSWTQHYIITQFYSANSVCAADMDGDGDLDVLGTSKNNDEISWWQNRGGQFALATTDTTVPVLLQGTRDDLLEVVATHKGRSGDTDMELATLDLLFEESASDPLSTSEANAMIDNLYVYLDTGSGTFESGSDTLVTTVATLSLTAGVQTVTFSDGNADVQVGQGIPRAYFVVTQLTGNASSQTPNQFRVTHITESSSTAEDRDHDIELALEHVPNRPSTIVHASVDTDGDGLLDYDETNGTYGYVTLINDADSDDDGINDGTEVTLGTDPNDDQNLPSASEVWVQFNYSSGIELGTNSQPFNSLNEGTICVTVSGTVKIKGNTGDPDTSETPRITKQMRVEAVGDAVRIGVP